MIMFYKTDCPPYRIVPEGEWSPTRVYNSSPNTVTSLLGGASGDHAFVMSATRFWHRITVECDLPSILPVALISVASVGIFNALTTTALGVRKFANCVPVRSLKRFSQWRL